MAETLKIIAGGLILIVIFALVWNRRRMANGSVPSTPDRVLGEAEIYLSYGRKKQAIKVLRDGLLAFPGDPAIQAKLDQLRATT